MTSVRNELRSDLLGATPMDQFTTRFRVWAPKCKSLQVQKVNTAGEVLDTFQLASMQNGYHCGDAPMRSGDLYFLQLDKARRYPDPASRFQPQGVHGPSQIVDNQFQWSDTHWQGVDKRNLVIYELHVGAFTQEGTYRAAQNRLDELVDLGITAIELMPVAQSPGKWNWGYDGVNLFAPRNSYGTPDDFRSLIDRCHALGLAVFLDVVYNHLGPEGNYLSEFAPYFSRKHRTPWGEAFAFDGRNARQVREFITQNAIYWLRDFHLDGLRFDAIHFMFDDSGYSILDEIRDRVDEFATTVNRTIHLIAEANVFDHRLTPDIGESSGQHKPYDACWCDDIMHSLYSIGVPSGAMTNRPYSGASDLSESLRHGYIYQGPPLERINRDALIENSNGTSDRRYIESLIVALQTHDAVGNHPHGKRLHQLSSIEFQAAAAAIVLLYPSIPMMFMGEPEACDSPFPFFVDFEDPSLRRRVDRGRAAEYPRHEWKGAPSPSDPVAFFSAKCDDPDRQNRDMRRWYRSLLQLRRELINSRILNARNMTVDADLNSHCFCLRYCDEDHAKTIEIYVRLAPHQDNDKSPVPIPLQVSGRVILDSKTLGDSVPTESPTIELSPNHAIVVEA